MAHSDYYIKGFKVPSVTEVTGLLDKGPQFNEWLMREGQHAKDIGREARDRGTAVHEAARMATDGVPRLPGDDEDLTEVCAANLTAWLKAHVRLSYFTEQPVHNARYLYAGTPDNVCLLEEANDGHVFLLDYKNSGAPELYPAWTAQVAAYCYSDEVLRIVGHRQIRHIEHIAQRPTQLLADIDRDLDVAVTRVLQTVAGRMIFAQPRVE